MPCRDSGPTAAQEAAERRAKNRKAAKLKAERQRLDDVTRMLCTLANATENEGFGMINDFGLSKTEAVEIRAWLKEHNEADAKRRAKEEAAAKKKANAEEKKKTQAQLKKSALSKLTAKERKALEL